MRTRGSFSVTSFDTLRPSLAWLSDWLSRRGVPLGNPEATAGIEPAMKVLQTSALPLGYVA